MIVSGGGWKRVVPGVELRLSLVNLLLVVLRANCTYVFMYLQTVNFVDFLFVLFISFCCSRFF